MTSTCFLCMRRQGENSRASRADDRLSPVVPAVRSVRRAFTTASFSRCPHTPATTLAVGVSRVPDLRCRVGGSGSRLQPRLYRARLQVEEGVTAEPVLVELVLPAGAQHAEAVLDTPAQVDRRRVSLVPGRAGYLADPGADGDGLGDDLIVEDEVIGVALERQGGEQRAAEC